MKIRILFLVIGGILLLACQVNGNLSSLVPTPTAIPQLTQTITPTLEPFPTPPFLTLTPPAVTSCVVATGIESGVLHIRSCPGLACRVVDYAHEGQAVQIGDVKSGWAWIGDGWVYSRFLECEK